MRQSAPGAAARPHRSSSARHVKAAGDSVDACKPRLPRRTVSATCSGRAARVAGRSTGHARVSGSAGHQSGALSHSSDCVTGWLLVPSARITKTSALSSTPMGDVDDPLAVGGGGREHERALLVVRELAEVRAVRARSTSPTAGPRRVPRSETGSSGRVRSQGGRRLRASGGEAVLVAALDVHDIHRLAVGWRAAPRVPARIEHGASVGETAGVPASPVQSPRSTIVRWQPVSTSSDLALRSAVRCRRVAPIE